PGVLFGAVDSGRLVPLSIVSLLPDLSTVPLLAEPLLSIVPLFPVFDLSLTVREVVPRELMVPSERRDDARSETSVFRIADLVPVTIRPLASLLTLRDTEVSDRASSRRSDRSEEHTSELQSRANLVCRLLLER